MFIVVSHASSPKGTACHIFLRTLYMRVHGMRTVTKFCVVIKLYRERIFTGRPRQLPWSEFCCDLNADA